jgi:hypothetical protein
MGRTPIDKVPQRRLLDMLRVDIERAMAGDRRADSRIGSLVAENPRSVRSVHIAYNLGRKKHAWLYARYLREADAFGALPLGRDASGPLVGARRKSWEKVATWLSRAYVTT